MSPVLSTFAGGSLHGWFPLSVGGGTTYELITATTLGSVTTTVTFSSIPQTYRHLQLRMVSSGGSSPLALQLNGVSTTSYSFHRLYADGGSNLAAGGATQSSIPLHTGGTLTSYIVDLLEYTDTTKNRVVRALGGYYGATNSGYTALISGSLYSTSAATSLSITATGGFNSGSRFYLYGIKG